MKNEKINVTRNMLAGLAIAFGIHSCIHTPSEATAPITDERDQAITSFINTIHDANPAAGNCLIAAMAVFSENNPNVDQSIGLMWSTGNCLKRAKGFDPVG
tara:strand:- start:395 stop:697 length:303 start_codon:yes stop_codon:yes gene_type:complete